MIKRKINRIIFLDHNKPSARVSGRNKGKDKDSQFTTAQSDSGYTLHYLFAVANLLRNAKSAIPQKLRKQINQRHSLFFFHSRHQVVIYVSGSQPFYTGDR